MSDFGYDSTSKASILSFAKRLVGRTLREAATLPKEIADNPKHKGDLGTLVENYFFLINPGNSASPDFAQANLELKTTGLLRRADGELKAKERLVLTMINYMELVGEEWGTSSFLKKCSSMLILFYEYVKALPVIDRKFIVEPKLYELPREDLHQIQQDWEFIRNKIRDGKAHELSEGDTFYLGACRKGAGGENEKLRPQPFSDLPAKARAFAFKQGYVDLILSNHLNDLKALGVGSSQGIEQATKAIFEGYVGRTFAEIASDFGMSKTSKNQKGFHRQLVERILGGNASKIRELRKAGVELKTIRVNKSWKPNEAMSFPGFKFLEIVNENWDDSDFAEKLESKFLFVVFRTDEHLVERLEKVAFWNMPFEDREEARAVWERTKAQVAVDCSKLPTSKESRVAHVRPHARNAADTLLTPQGTQRTKQGFWLNQSYIQQVVQLL